MHVAHCDIISLMIIAHDSANGWTAVTWEAGNGYYAIQGHSVSPILVPIETSCDLLVIDTNLSPILHRFQITTDYLSNFRERPGSASI